MAHLDGTQVEQFLKEAPEPSRFATAFALRAFVHSATYSPNYAADERWAEAIVPSPAGTQLLTRVSAQPIQRPDLYLALFGLFWFQEPLINVAESNLELIKNLILEEAAKLRLRWPPAQGRVLYDRYNQLFNDLHDSLTAIDVKRLLDGMVQGVYQVGNLISGPLGLIESNCRRYFPPTMTFGLWHCPLVDCRKLHEVTFEPPLVPLIEGYRLLQRSAIQLWSTPSRWEQVLIRWPSNAADAAKISGEMPLFLGDCVVGEDRTNLLAKALSGSNAGSLRAIISQLRPKYSGGESVSLAKRIPTDEQLQLLLVMGDIELKTLIDQMVTSQEMTIPSSEVRQVDATKRAIHRFSSRLQLSALGIRREKEHPILLLRKLLWVAYLESGETTELDWRLRKPTNVTTQYSLMQYLRNNKPPAAIESLILTSPRITRSIANALDTSIDTPNETSAALLLWKLGFDLPRDDRRLSTLSRLFNTFATALEQASEPFHVNDREKIRSAGANAFVEFEGFLEEVIAYVTWILASDHPLSTGFVYSRSAAMTLVPNVLGEDLSSGEVTIQWKISGNTLGVNLRYLQQLRDWLTSLGSADRTKLKRSEDDFNHSPAASVISFAFNHKQLWADAAPDSLDRLAQKLSSCIEQLGRVDICFIRNGLEHYREPSRFPSRDRIFGAIKTIQNFIQTVENERLFPMPYWLVGARDDAYSQKTIEFQDDRGRQVFVHLPRAVKGLPTLMLPNDKPSLLSPGDLLGMPNADIIFSIKENSVYTRYWSNYPIQRPLQRLTVSSDETSAAEMPDIPIEKEMGSERIKN